VDQLCSEVKAGHESGAISFKGAVKRITDMGDVCSHHVATVMLHPPRGGRGDRGGQGGRGQGEVHVP
jgi:hypothetical protein